MERITPFKIPPTTPKNGRLKQLEPSTASTRPAPWDAGRVTSTRSCSGSEAPEPGPPRLCAGRDRRRRRSATPGRACGERYASVDRQAGPRHTSPAFFMDTTRGEDRVHCADHVGGVSGRVEEHVAKAMGLRVEPINRHSVASYELEGVLAAVRDGKYRRGRLPPRRMRPKKLEEAR